MSRLVIINALHTKLMFGFLFDEKFEGCVPGCLFLFFMLM